MLNRYNNDNNYESEKSSHIRLVIMGCVVALLFCVLVVKLFSMQIMSGDYYNREVKDTTVKEVQVTAARGNIYDKYGRAVADSVPASVVNIDPSISVDNLNDALLEVIKLLEENGEELSISLPISEEEPHTFLFDGSPSLEKTWKGDLNLDEDITADEAYKELIEKFDIPTNLDNSHTAQLIAIRSAMYQKRYSKYVPVQLACQISEKTSTAIQERNSDFPCVYVSTELLREYPYAESLSHILGYTGKITQEELETYKDDSYTSNDVVGKDGIEKAFELELNGEDGTELVEVDSTGRRISTISEGAVSPKAGNNVFLTLDANLQKKAYKALESSLAKTQISRLSGTSKDFTYNIDDVMKSIINSNSLHLSEVMSSETGTTQYSIRSAIVKRDANSVDDVEKAREALLTCYEKGDVRGNTILLAMIEQGTMQPDDDMISKLKSGGISSLRAVLNMLTDGTMTPAMTAMDPCTGSAVVTDVKTGGVLAAVSYPSYDNNEFVNNFNSKYYRQLQSSTLTPMVNRPFTEPRAPGSIFKMITAVTGLQEGFITPNTTIHDEGTFKDAGVPYAKCWINNGNGSHGDVTVSHALEVSCNYFFYTLSYSFGKNKKDTDGIALLNKYMTSFGLNDPVGVEIYELYDSMSDYPSKISGPEYKEYVTKLRNPDATASDLKWTAGDTIRTAIGQSLNNYTSAQMSKYVATLVNGGTRYKMHLLDSVTTDEGEVVKKSESEIEDKITIDKKNLDAVFNGMLLVTTGENGTLRKVFSDYPVKVGAKSGTAQESKKRSEHTTFVAFAPYEEPQIAISVMIPFGNDSATTPAPNTAKQIISEYLKVDNKPETNSKNELTK